MPAMSRTVQHFLGPPVQALARQFRGQYGLAVHLRVDTEHHAAGIWLPRFLADPGAGLDVVLDGLVECLLKLFHTVGMEAHAIANAGLNEAGPCESVCVQPCAGLYETLSQEGAGETERMKPLKSPPALLLLAGLFSIDAHALAGAISPNLDSGMRGGDNCAARSSDGGASLPDEIDCMSNPESCVHKASWYRDRDNSMFPVSTKRVLVLRWLYLILKLDEVKRFKFSLGFIWLLPMEP